MLMVTKLISVITEYIRQRRRGKILPFRIKGMATAPSGGSASLSATDWISAINRPLTSRSDLIGCSDISSLILDSVIIRA